MSVTVYDCDGCGDSVVSNLVHECTDSRERIQTIRAKNNRRAHRMESGTGFEPRSNRSRAMAARAYRILNNQ